MAESHGLPAEPVFVVCNARSGSTLVRYLLDTHPDIACPAETKAVQVARSLLTLHNDLSGNPTLEMRVREQGMPSPTPDSVTGSRDIISGIIATYLARRGKTVWCDKSLDSVHALDVIRQVFPGARFLCLHRHAMDVIASLLESCRWGYAYFDVQPYITRRLGNFPLALAEYWTVRTDLMLKLQQSDAATHAVHYEQLVRDPGTVLTGILQFLGLAHGEALVQTMTESAFLAEHDPGAADWKIPFVSSVEQHSVERGRSLGHQFIAGPVLEQMNTLLSLLHYPRVDENWNLSSDVGEGVDPTLLAAFSAEERVGRLVDGLLAPRLARYRGPGVRRVRLTLTFGAGCSAHWLIDTAAATIERDAGAGEAPLSVTTRAEVVHDVLVGGLPVQNAQRLKMLPVEGPADDKERDAVDRFLRDLLTAA